MKILKYLLMIVTAPVILVLMLFVWFCMGLPLAAGQGAEFEICNSGLGI